MRSLIGKNMKECQAHTTYNQHSRVFKLWFSNSKYFSKSSHQIIKALVFALFI